MVTCLHIHTISHRDFIYLERGEKSLNMKEPKNSYVVKVRLGFTRCGLKGSIWPSLYTLSLSLGFKYVEKERER